MCPGRRRCERNHFYSEPRSPNFAPARCVCTCRRPRSLLTSLESTALAPGATTIDAVRAATPHEPTPPRSALLWLSRCTSRLTFARGEPLRRRPASRPSFSRSQQSRFRRRCQRPGARRAACAHQSARERALCALAVGRQHCLLWVRLAPGRHPASLPSPLECSALARGVMADDPVRAAPRHATRSGSMERA